MHAAPDPETQVASVPDNLILDFARRAQKMGLPRFTGYEIKPKNLLRFRSAMTELARQGHPLALHFLEHYARPDPIPPASSPQPKAEAPDRSLADMVEAAHDLREELLAVMRETASRMRELQGAVEGLQRELNEVKSAVDRLIADDQRVGPLPDNFYSDFVNTLSAICRQFLLEKGEPGCGM